MDEKIVSRAKRYAAMRGTSVSKLVAGYLDLLSRESDEDSDTPVLRRIEGVLKKGDVEDYRRHLEEKYG